MDNYQPTKEDYERLDFSGIKFDPSRPYGEIHGVGADGAKWEQDGFHFDAQGNVLTQEWLLPKARKEELARKLAERRIRAEADEYVAKRLASLGFQPKMDEEGRLVDVDTAMNEETEGELAKSFDLVSWAKGTLKARFADVQAAASAQYGFRATGTQALIIFMVDEGKIRPEDVKVISMQGRT